MRLENSQKRKVAIFRRIATLLFPLEAPNELQQADGQRESTTHQISFLERVLLFLVHLVSKEEVGSDDDKPMNLEEIYIHFEDWAEDINALIDSINRLPGHTDKDVSNRMGLFASDLKVKFSMLFVSKSVNDRVVLVPMP